MSSHFNSPSKQRFLEAKAKLVEALHRIEECATAKIEEVIQNSEMFNNQNKDAVLLSAKVIEQNSLIENLNQEINSIQSAMEEMGKETEFLKEKNNFFADKMFKFKSQGSNLINAIESDLTRIKEIVGEK